MKQIDFALVVSVEPGVFIGISVVAELEARKIFKKLK